MITTMCFLFFVKSPIILPLYSSKIAWDNYAPLQMISENFPASGKSLNCVEKPRGISGATTECRATFNHALNEPARLAR